MNMRGLAEALLAKGMQTVATRAAIARGQLLRQFLILKILSIIRSIGTPINYIVKCNKNVKFLKHTKDHPNRYKSPISKSKY
jgi:hypothetical protein